MWEDHVLWKVLHERLLSDVLVAVNCRGVWSGTAIAVGPTAYLTCRHVISNHRKPENIELTRVGKSVGSVIGVIKPLNGVIDAVLLLVDTPTQYADVDNHGMILCDDDAICVAYVRGDGVIGFTTGVVKGYDEQSRTFYVEGAPTVGGESGGLAVLLRGGVQKEEAVVVSFVGMHIGRNDDAMGTGEDRAEFISLHIALQHMPHPMDLLA